MTDSWLGLDKLEHYMGCGCVVALVHLALTRAQLWEGHRLVLAATAGACAAAGKELGDQLGVGSLIYCAKLWTFANTLEH